MSFRNNWCGVITIVIFIAISQTARCQNSITLKQAIDIALKNSLQIKLAKISEAIATENVRAAKLAVLPSLNATSGLNYSFGRNEDPFSSEFFYTKIASSSGGISTSLPLFQWSQKLKQISQNKYLLEASKNTSKKVENDLTLSVIMTYLQVLFNKEVLKASSAQLNVARQSLDQERKQFDIGNKTMVDLSQSQAQVASAELKHNSAKNQLQLSYFSLLNYLELDPANQIDISRIDTGILSERLTYSVTEVHKKALQVNPAIKLAENQTLAAASGIKLARTAFFPKLSLQLGIGSGFSSIRDRAFLNSAGNLEYKKATLAFQLKDNFNQYAGINLLIPVFNGMISKINVNRAKLTFQNAQIAEQIERNTFRKIISQALLDLDISIDQLKASKVAYETSTTAFNAIEKRYNAGLVNSIVLNQAQTTMNVAEIDLIKAKYDVIFKNKVIQFYIGELIY